MVNAQPLTHTEQYIIKNYQKYMERYLDKLVAVESLLIAVEISDGDDVVLLDAEAIVDLTEFNLTPQEVEKFGKILKKMNVSLADSFQKHFPATSVISEIRSQ